MSESFNDPHVTINRVYTRKGDSGTTALVGGQRVSKHHARIETYGTVDELNAVVGMVRASLMAHLEAGVPAPADDGMPDLPWLAAVLGRVQHELFNLGSVLATLPQDLHPRQPRVTAEDVTWLETVIDRCNALPTLRSFVLPGGNHLDAELHLARTVCRRAERLLTHLGELEETDGQSLAYLNRLSDAFFVFGRFACLRLGAPEHLWNPNAPRP